jgi:hypothetical protein
MPLFFAFFRVTIYGISLTKSVKNLTEPDTCVDAPQTNLGRFGAVSRAF